MNESHGETSSGGSINFRAKRPRNQKIFFWEGTSGGPIKIKNIYEKETSKHKDIMPCVSFQVIQTSTSILCR
jgi:hypothetical protein